MINYELERRRLASKIFVKLLNQKSNPKKLAEDSVNMALILQAKFDATNTCPHKGRVMATGSGTKCYDCGAPL